MKRAIFLFLFIGFGTMASAQSDAWVYFTDKLNVEEALQNPITILSSQAIARKHLHNIPIDFRDVPVNEAYISLLKAENGITVLAKSKWMNAVHVRGELPEINALKHLEGVDKIEFADRNMEVALRSTDINDKFIVETEMVDFNYGSAQNQVDMLDLKALHLDDFTGEGIVIAVIDAGFPNVNTMSAFNRLRAHNRLLGGYDFVNRSSDIYDITANSHGTKVLSTMAGYVENEFVGTAPDASYYLFRTEASAFENPVEESFWVEAAERADSLGVHIINSSLGYNTFDNSNYNYQPQDMNGTTTFISRGAQIASEKGILVANSAGNSGNDAWGIVTAPADVASVVTVGAVNGNGEYAAFSSRGNAFQSSQKPDVVAQGLGSGVVNELDQIVTTNGTSFSAPLVAGALACLWQAMPNANAGEIKQYMVRSASQYLAPDNYLGYGIPNFSLALSNVLASPTNQTLSFKVYPNPVFEELNIQIPTSSRDIQVKIYNALGNLVQDRQFLETTIKMDISHLSSGIYLLQMLSDKQTANFKFIKN